MLEKQDGLEILIKSKVLNENVSLKQLLEATKFLDGTPIDGVQAKWCFIVKGKFIYRDDEEKPAKVPSTPKEKV